MEKQGVDLMGRNTTGPPCSVGRPICTRPAAGRDRPRKLVLIPALAPHWRCQANVAKLLIDEGCTPFTMLSCGVTGPKFTKCSYDVPDHRR